jgi:uncharacterized protein (TIGR00297 family)
LALKTRAAEKIKQGMVFMKNLVALALLLILSGLVMEISNFSVLRSLVYLGCLIVGYYFYSRKSLDFSGFFSGMLMGLVILATTPLIMWFVPLMAFFVIGSLASKYGWRYKRRRGVAENPRGRGVWNVIGNGGVGLLMAILFFLTQKDIFLYAYIGSIASACADTVATEMGQMSNKRPVLIINFKKVPIGTTGAISLFGEIMAFVGAAVIAAIPLFYFGALGFWNLKGFLIITAAGFLGCQVDSLIGSTVELRDLKKKNGIRFFNNHSTNFLSTLAAAIICGIFYLLAF